MTQSDYYLYRHIANFAVGDELSKDRHCVFADGVVVYAAVDTVGFVKYRAATGGKAVKGFCHRYWIDKERYVTGSAWFGTCCYVSAGSGVISNHCCQWQKAIIIISKLASDADFFDSIVAH